MNLLLLFCLLALCLYAFRDGVWKRDQWAITGLPEPENKPNPAPTAAQYQLRTPKAAPRPRPYDPRLNSVLLDGYRPLNDEPAPRVTAPRPAESAAVT
ncbi:hypothetical protein [Solirubrum puertoriconensis]|uniref:Uncharacterized protein n=1 Tax=Solirubrum puertoriconensis TaxID=1751427 RepID=A0A9X0HLT4_SOLP1|nr:hypothetical protein [Solirubrum puertoriconensis]KUG08159.1 hypothetical protein ASU33_08170 [Solirubrum puertoriconensis]